MKLKKNVLFSSIETHTIFVCSFFLCTHDLRQFNRLSTRTKFARQHQFFFIYTKYVFEEQKVYIVKWTEHCIVTSSSGTEENTRRANCFHRSSCDASTAGTLTVITIWLLTHSLAHSPSPSLSLSLRLHLCCILFLKFSSHSVHWTLL